MEILIGFIVVKLLITLVLFTNITKQIKYYGGTNRFFIVTTKKYDYWVYLPKKDRPMPYVERGTQKRNS